MVDSIIEIHKNFLEMGFIIFLLCIIVEALIVFSILLLIYAVIDSQTGKTIIEQGLILDKDFTAGTTGTGAGIAINPQGGAMPVMTSTSTSDVWKIVVKRADNVIMTIEVSKEEYYSKEIGDNISFKSFYGGISKSLISSEL